MICPSCGTHIKDGLLVCPACRVDLSLTLRMPRLTERWCATCGVLIPPGASECPHCGMPTDSPRPRKADPVAPVVSTTSMEDDLDFDAEATRAMARIESAVPAGPDTSEDAREEDGAPRMRATLLAAMAALLFVGGTVLYITQPWNPTAFSTSATEPADTSMAGFPGELHTLSGQDESAQVQVQSGDELSYQKLVSAHDQLTALHDRLVESEEQLRTTGITGSVDERVAGRDNHAQIAVELSNLIASFDMVDVSSGTYAEDVENMRTLGNWLRNWSDTLTTCWSVSASLDDANAHQDEVLSALYGSANTDGANAYRTLFEQYTEGWVPAPPAS